MAKILKNIEDKKLTIDGACFFCDGSARPNPGTAGWGIHGYTYYYEQPKKGAGLKFNITDYGYLEKGKDIFPDAKIITPIQYVDCFGGFKEHTTNTVSEAIAVKNVFDYAIKYDIKNYKIITDSETTIKAATQWIDKWKNNNWYKSNGDKVANVEYLKLLDESMQKAKELGHTFTFQWIKGHSGNIGNDCADTNATAGTMYTLNGNYTEYSESAYKADEYWLKESTRPAELFHQYLVWSAECNPDSDEYYTSSNPVDLDLLGRGIYGINYAWVKLNTKCDLIKEVKEKQRDVCMGMPELICMNLSNLFKIQTETIIKRHKQNAFYVRNGSNKSLYTLNSEILTSHRNPPMLAYRFFDAIANLKGLYNTYILNLGNKQDDISITDITNYFYKDKIIKTKTVKEMISTLKPGLSSIEVEINITTGKEIKLQKITIFLGQDLPNRNTLKKFEELNPEIKVISQKLTDGTFTYYFYLKTDTCVAMFAPVFSNIVKVK